MNCWSKHSITIPCFDHLTKTLCFHKNKPWVKAACKTIMNWSRYLGSKLLHSYRLFIVTDHFIVGNYFRVTDYFWVTDYFIVTDYFRVTDNIVVTDYSKVSYILLHNYRRLTTDYVIFTNFSIVTDYSIVTDEFIVTNCLKVIDYRGQL